MTETPAKPETPKADGSASETSAAPAAKLHWLVRKGTIKVLWIVGLAVLAVLVYADIYLTPHPHFGIDGTFGFHAWYGLLTCIAMVLVAKFLGKFIGRKDTYYDDQ
jgi:hypothetical protein